MPNKFIVNSNPRKDKKKSFRCALILMFHVHSKFTCCLKNSYIEKCVFQVLTIMVFMARQVLSSLVSLRVSLNSAATEVCIFIPVLRCSRPIIRNYSNEVLSPHILTR